MSRALQAALGLAEEYGIPVFPCRPDKKPYTEHGFKDATTNLEQIEQAWTRCADALIGVPTGHASGIDVLDIDPDGRQWYSEHTDRLAAGRIHRTRRDGYHLLYRAPQGEIRNSASQIARGVDVRGDGGYIVWWPAHGCEAVGSLEEMTEWPEWLVSKRAATIDSDKVNTDEDGKIHAGQGRNDYLSREAFRLRKQGMSPDQFLPILQALNRAKCDPPLSDEEVAGVAQRKKRVLPAAVTEKDFFAYMPAHQYIYVPTRELWPASSVNASVVMQSGKANEWLDERRAVQQMTWAPGLPMVVENRLVADGGWIEREGVRTFNLYRPPLELDGDPAKAGLWLEHVHHLYPSDAEHIIRWLAQRVQRPGDKINHALFFGGVPGIGKDTILEPIKPAVGDWNVKEVSPKQLLGRFNPFLKSVILRVSEARDMGDVDRYALYEALKTLEAAPPNVLTCDEKHLREHAVMNVTGVIITSNHKTDGIYLPADDRRHYVAWSDRKPADFPAGYWRDLYGWYEAGGNGHVAAYLTSLDISSFDAKAPPAKTPAFWDIVDANRAPEDAELADVLDSLGNPAGVTVTMLCAYAGDKFREWLQERRNSRQLPHRMEAAGYAAVRSEGAKDGLWKVDGRRQVIYAKTALCVRDRIAAATSLCREARQ